MSQDAYENIGLYAERMRAIVAALDRGLRRGRGEPRRRARDGAGREARVAASATRRPSSRTTGSTPSAFPSTANYVALGHLHLAQQLPGGPPIWYSGSPIQVDFGEAGAGKHVLIVEAAPGQAGEGRVGPADERRAAAHADRDVRGAARRSPGPRTSSDAGCGCASPSRRAPGSPTTCARCSATVSSRCASSGAGETERAPSVSPHAAAPRTSCSPLPRRAGDRGRPARRALRRAARRGADRERRASGHVCSARSGPERRSGDEAGPAGGAGVRRVPRSDRDRLRRRRAVRPRRPDRIGEVDRDRRDLLRALRQRPPLRPQGERRPDRHHRRARGAGEPHVRGRQDARTSRRASCGGRSPARVRRRSEARLEAVDGDVLAGSVGEIDAAVEDLLGLTFEHFTRAVVLPQNEFARFLHDKPAARQDLLVRLLGFDVYERMMRAARNRAAEQESAVKLAEQRIEDLADCTPEQLAVWDEWLALYTRAAQGRPRRAHRAHEAGRGGHRGGGGRAARARDRGAARRREDAGRGHEADR